MNSSFGRLSHFINSQKEKDKINDDVDPELLVKIMQRVVMELIKSPTDDSVHSIEAFFNYNTMGICAKIRS